MSNRASESVDAGVEHQLPRGGKNDPSAVRQGILHRGVGGRYPALMGRQSAFEMCFRSMRLDNIPKSETPLLVARRGVPVRIKVDEEKPHMASSIIARCARRMALTFFIRLFTDGFVKNVRFLNSFNTPDRSYFFLNRRIARSMGSFSPMIMPTR
jgi:hypothetical protein